MPNVVVYRVQTGKEKKTKLQVRKSRLGSQKAGSLKAVANTTQKGEGTKREAWATLLFHTRWGRLCYHLPTCPAAQPRRLTHRNGCVV